MPSETTQSPRKYRQGTGVADWRSLELLVCLGLGILLFWKGLLPAVRTLNTDFPNYYLVARLLREGYGLDRIYDWIWLQRIKDHWGLDQSLVGFAGLTPFSAIPVVPLSFLSALAAKRVWVAINLGLLVACVELLARSTSLGRRRIWLLSLLAILPLRASFLDGQMHLLVLFLLVGAFWAHRRGRELLCGVCVAIAAGLKVYPLVFIFYFVWKREWRAAFAAVTTTIALVLVCGVWIGWDVVRIYSLEMLPRSLQGEMLDPYNLHAASAAALFHRMFLFEPDLNPVPLVNSPSLYAVVYPLWQMVVFLPLFAVVRPMASRETEGVEWSALALALLVSSPVPSSYHFVVAILPAVLFVDACLRKGERVIALVATMLYGLVSIADWFSMIGEHLGGTLQGCLAFSRLWLSAGWLVLLVASLYRDRRHDSERVGHLRFVVPALLGVAGLAIGIVGYRHHFRDRAQEMSRRIATPPGIYLATRPEPYGGRYLFVAMKPEGYRVVDADEHQIRDGRGSSVDQLSYGVGLDGRVGVELAGEGGSVIVQGSDGSVLSQDAESPVFSVDGGMFAFVRERKGHGSLWIAPLGASRDPATRETTDEFDVRQAAFIRSGALVLLAKHHHHAMLYTLVPSAAPASFLSTNGDIGSFAIAPDERRIAFTELVRNRWQLMVFDRQLSRTTQLTDWDCNAFTPSWVSATEILYATDCGRGVGLTALATMEVRPGL